MSIDDIENEIAARLDALAQLKARVKLDMGDSGVLILNAFGDGTTLSRNEGEADCTLRISATNMRKLIAGTLHPVLALTIGKLRVSGDMAVASRLGELLRS